MNNLSVFNKVINDTFGITNEQIMIVLQIYKDSPTPLTTNEMLKKYYEVVSTIPASHPSHKILLSARHNGLKAARTALTHRGLIREIEPRDCTVTHRKVSVFRYVGIEYTELEQLQHELSRRLEDKERIEGKIRELQQQIQEILVK